MNDKRVAELARKLATSIIREASKWNGDTFETGQMLFHSLRTFADELDPVDAPGDTAKEPPR